MEVAVLDACVLFQGKLTDFLLNLAEAGAFDPVWSDEIHAEWLRNVHAHIGIPMAKLEKRLAAMEDSFPAASCPADPILLAQVQSLCTTDRQRRDAHVIASAIAAEATVIVTHNIPDFPQAILDRYGLRKMRPDAFCEALHAAAPDTVVAGARAHRLSMGGPPYDPDQYLALIGSGKVGLPRTSLLLEARKDDL